MSMQGTHGVRVAAYSIGGALLTASVVLAGTEPHASESGAQLDLIKWAVTQGGLVLVTLVILWSYRKDFRTVLMMKDEQAKILIAREQVLIDLIGKVTTAMTINADASQMLTRAIERLEARS